MVIFSGEFCVLVCTFRVSTKLASVFVAREDLPHQQCSTYICMYVVLLCVLEFLRMTGACLEATALLKSGMHSGHVEGKT